MIYQLLLISCLGAAPTDWDKFHTALRRVECGDVANPPRGDDGRAIGPYQIWQPYHQDSRIPGRWEDCRNRTYSERVMHSYWRRYCPAAVRTQDWRTLARVHNGGPAGARRTATLPYWHRVQKEMKK